MSNKNNSTLNQNEENDIIVGRNSVVELLKSGRKINRLVIAEGSRDKTIQKIISLARENQIIFENVPRARLDKIHSNHQGVIAYTTQIEYSTIEEITAPSSLSPKPLILLLDELEDPHNFGAILRTADAVGVNGVLIPKRRSVSLNATVAKTSAGAIEYVKVAQINNVAQTIKNLREQNFWIVGSDAEGTINYNQVDYKKPIVLVIGSEGKGLRRLTKENCDELVKIPMIGKINSLNASVAAAILMYEIFNQRNK